MQNRQENDRDTTVACLADVDAARSLIEELEEKGVPTEAIDLAGHVNEEAGGFHTEKAIFTDSIPPIIGYGLAGAAIGAGLGAVLAVGVDMRTAVGAILGAVFGLLIGGTVGGVSVFKYGSRAWNETYQTVADGTVTVTVRTDDHKIARQATEVMQERRGSGVIEFDPATR